MKPFFAEVKFSFLGQKPWTIVHGFVFGSLKKVLRKVYHLKGHEKRSLMDFVSVA